jgi:hypothetical protein|nr:MAG TPA: hypothetical protein [Caudoviricetes sp.]
MIILMYGHFVAYSACVHRVLMRLWEAVFITLAHRLLQV